VQEKNRGSVFRTHLSVEVARTMFRTWGTCTSVIDGQIRAGVTCHPSTRSRRQRALRMLAETWISGLPWIPLLRCWLCHRCSKAQNHMLPTSIAHLNPTETNRSHFLAGAAFFPTWTILISSASSSLKPSAGISSVRLENADCGLLRSFIINIAC
jgi:hypothetical protein